MRTRCKSLALTEVELVEVAVKLNIVELSLTTSARGDVTTKSKVRS